MKIAAPHIGTGDEYPNIWSCRTDRTDELPPIVAEEPACGLVHARNASVEIRLKKCVGRQLEDLPSARHRSRDLVTPLLHEKRQIDNDGPVYGEEQRLKSRLMEGIA